MKGTAYLLQATLISLSCLATYLSDEFYNALNIAQLESSLLEIYFKINILIIIVLSVIQAYSKKKILSYFILASFVLATFIWGTSSLQKTGGLLVTIILIIGLCFNIFLVFKDKMFRQAKSNNLWLNGFKTFIQIICVWTITLIIFPWIILESFNVPIIRSPESKVLAIILFTAFSFLGLFSSYVIVKYGSGTPLPLDQTNRLVTSGPYKYVRNPMAIAGLGQGIAVAILLNSIHIFIYTIIGALLWQVVVKPIEEKNMLERFGKEYKEYKQKISCWFPTFNSKI